MFVVTEADAAAIRIIFQERGELSAVIELRRQLPQYAKETDRATWRIAMQYSKPTCRRGSTDCRGAGFTGW
jgi:hypothetical protein